MSGTGPQHPRPAVSCARGATNTGRPVQGDPPTNLDPQNPADDRGGWRPWVRPRWWAGRCRATDLGYRCQRRRDHAQRDGQAEHRHHRRQGGTHHWTDQDAT